MSRSANYMELLDKHPIMATVIVITLHYQDNFGRERQFVFNERRLETVNDKAYDEPIKAQMSRLGITKCRAKFAHFGFARHKFLNHSCLIPHKIMSSPRRRTINETD